MKKILFLALILSALQVYAQQDPLVGSYVVNPIFVNPGYTGITNNVNFFANFRQQWAGFEGSPTTLSAGLHTSLRNNTLGTGMIFHNDSYGDISTTGFSALFAYKIKLDDKVISFGMSGGGINYKLNSSSLNLRDQGDPSFAAVNDLKFNLGAGMAFLSEKMFIGISAPRLIKNSYQVEDYVLQASERHYYLSAAYFMYLMPGLDLKPSLLFKAVKGSTPSVDLNVNLVIKKAYQVGVLTRNLNTFGALAQFSVKEDFRFYYVFEVPTNQSVGPGFTTHEFGINIRKAMFFKQDKLQVNF